MYIYKERGIKKIEMGSGGSSRRKDADDGDYDSDQDQYDQGDTYDDSSMQQEEERQRAKQVLDMVNSGKFVVTSTDTLGKFLGDQVPLPRNTVLDLVRQLSENEKGLVHSALEAHAGSKVSPRTKKKLYDEWQKDHLLKTAKMRAKSY